MLQNKSMFINMVLFFFAFQHQAFAQLLTTDEVKQLQEMSDGTEDFDVYILHNHESEPNQVTVIIGADLANKSEIKSIKNLMASFTKVFILANDATTLIGKEIKNDHAHCTMVRDSTRLALAHINWGLPTILFGSVAIVGSVMTCIDPSPQKILSTFVVGYFARDCYCNWKNRSIEFRTRSMAAALMQEVSAKKILVVMDRTSALLLNNKLITLGIRDQTNLLDEQQDEVKPIKKARQKKHWHKEKSLPQQKTITEEEVSEKMENWEKERKARMALEDDEARKEQIQKEWKKIDKSHK